MGAGVGTWLKLRGYTPDAFESKEFIGDIIQHLLELPTGDPWDDAELWTIFRYVRGSKRLQLPAQYRPVLFATAE